MRSGYEPALRETLADRGGSPRASICEADTSLHCEKPSVNGRKPASEKTRSGYEPAEV